MNRRDFIYAASVGAASATMPTVTVAQVNRETRNDAPQVGAKLRTITLEEHFASPGFIAGPGRSFIERLRTARGTRIIEQLQDVHRAEALNVPIYLHPTVPPKPVVDVLYGGFSPAVSAVFAAAGWGWHIETAVHLIRMILGGVFDRYPKLQVVIGHLGEGVPFMLPRLNRNLPMEMTKLARPLGAYLRKNVHYTFAGFNFPATFLDLLLEVGVERIMFSADHPYGSMAEARTFLDHIPVSAADRERIAHGNAERLFNL